MDGRYTNEQLLWIKEQLGVHGKYVVAKLQEAIDNKQLKQTEDLRNSLKYKITNQGINPVLQLEFLSYGRAVEIAKNKRSKNSIALAEKNANRQMLSGKSARKAKQRDTRWYARNVYGSLNRLIGILSYEYCEETVARMKQILSQQQIQTP